MVMALKITVLWNVMIRSMLRSVFQTLVLVHFPVYPFQLFSELLVHPVCGIMFQKTVTFWKQ